MTRNNKSSEDYLETIYLLSQKLPVVRSIDIAAELNFSKPSVSVAMKHLREANCIEVSSSGFITLTKEGLRIASSVYEKHKFIFRVADLPGRQSRSTSSDACEMEHNISDESFQAMKKFIQAKTDK
ncbi:MAG: metal-dependent transcriptional regulator [Dorea sp.]